MAQSPSTAIPKEDIKLKKIALILLMALLFTMTACNSDSSDGKAHTVNFESNGGSVVATVETKELTEAPVTAKEGYFFCGWYRDSELKNAVSYPFSVNKNMTLYAKWTNPTETVECEDSAVSYAPDDEYNYEAIYEAFPKTIDVEALAAQNYFIKIEATYDVYYEKTFNAPLDIGYLGAPKHDVRIVDFDEKGVANKNLPTSTEPSSESISIVVSAKDLLKTKYFFMVETYNLQNLVHFTNVKIKFTCQTAE